jgi:hypothetical protein
MFVLPVCFALVQSSAKLWRLLNYLENKCWFRWINVTNIGIIFTSTPSNSSITQNIKIPYFQNIVANSDLRDFVSIIFRGPVFIEMRVTWNILSIPGKIYEIFYMFTVSNFHTFYSCFYLTILKHLNPVQV